MSYNLNSNYGSVVANNSTPVWTWKTFYVTANGGTTSWFLQDVFIPDDWVVRVYSTITLALAACTADRWDTVVVAPDYTTAITDAEMTTAWTKKVRVVFADNFDKYEQIAFTESKSLPATTTWDIFNIIGLVEITSIIWVVTTVIQWQTCNLKLSTVSNSATTDICADLDINWDLAQSRYSITWTFANALINTAKGVPVAKQATWIIAQEWTIIATTSATNTGEIRWQVQYKPLTPWAKIYAA